MDKEFSKEEQELINIEPKWFVTDDPKRSLMCFGFCIGKGWFPLTRALIWTAKSRQKRWNKDYKTYVEWANDGLIGALVKEHGYWYECNSRYDKDISRITLVPITMFFN